MYLIIFLERFTEYIVPLDDKGEDEYPDKETHSHTSWEAESSIERGSRHYYKPRGFIYELE
jgi:hypothetical protein